MARLAQCLEAPLLDLWQKIEGFQCLVNGIRLKVFFDSREADNIPDVLHLQKSAYHPDRGAGSSQVLLYSRRAPRARKVAQLD